ncbi:Uncharacterised protein [Serratia plymuthica]|nr:Uncharacterised protein [Serratia plymuthica]VEI18982.1 Uncharacterised protein [Serratia plymuthica]
MIFRHGIPVLIIFLSGCSAIHADSSWDPPARATREQKQRIGSGESAYSVLHEGSPGIGGTLDWSTLWDR